MSMQIGYGSFRHPAGWANLVSMSAKVRYSPRKFKLATLLRAHVQGDIVLAAGEDEYDAATYINTMADAFSVDGLDWGLYHSDGTATPDFLWSNDPNSLTGNQVSYKSFPEGHGGEYASGRSFEYLIENEVSTPETALIEYHEVIEQTGTTGADIDWISGNRFHGPFPITNSDSSLQYTVQAGYAITMATWLDVPSPIANPPYEIVKRRRVKRSPPRRYPQGFEGYRIDWAFYYISDTPLNFVPTVR